jgi:hypothetical protein
LTVGGSIAAVNEWNKNIDPKWREQVSEWDRMNSLIVMLPSEEGARYIAIPVSWGLKPIVVATNGIFDMLDGEEVDPSDFLSKVFASVIDAYNPAGGTDLSSSVTPTFVAIAPTDLINDIRANRSWSGWRIKPTETYGDIPEDVRYFQSLRETTTGKASIKISEAFQKSIGLLVSPADINYSFEQIVGGAGRSVKKFFNLGASIATGEDMPLDEYPFLSRFYRQRGADELGVGAQVDPTLVQMGEEQTRGRANLKFEARDELRRLDSLPKEEARAEWDKINQANPELAAKIADMKEQQALGLTSQDYEIRDLGVTNGQRARYIYSQLQALNTDEERRALWGEYTQKKLISDTVGEQIKALMTAPKTT